MISVTGELIMHKHNVYSLENLESLEKIRNLKSRSGTL